MASSKHGRLFTERDVRGLIVLALTHPTIENPYRVADAVLSGEFGTYDSTFPADEPLFLLRGQDKAAGDAITGGYMAAAREAGASVEFRQAVVAAAAEMLGWQERNPDRVKSPD